MTYPHTALNNFPTFPLQSHVFWYSNKNLFDNFNTVVYTLDIIIKTNQNDTHTKTKVG